MSYQTVAVPRTAVTPPAGKRAPVTRKLDLVVPFTTPELTRAALEYAHRLAAGLDSEIRIVRVQLVPFPLALDHPPVSPEFLTQQMASFGAGEDQVDLRFARDFDVAIEGALKRDSVVVLASRRRALFGKILPARTDRLAAKLRAKGYTVCLM